MFSEIHISKWNNEVVCEYFRVKGPNSLEDRARQLCIEGAELCEFTNEELLFGRTLDDEYEKGLYFKRIAKLKIKSVAGAAQDLSIPAVVIENNTDKQKSKTCNIQPKTKSTEVPVIREKRSKQPHNFKDTLELKKREERLERLNSNTSSLGWHSSSSTSSDVPVSVSVSGNRKKAQPPAAAVAVEVEVAVVEDSTKVDDRIEVNRDVLKEHFWYYFNMELGNCWIACKSELNEAGEWIRTEHLDKNGKRYARNSWKTLVLSKDYFIGDDHAFDAFIARKENCDVNTKEPLFKLVTAKSQSGNAILAKSKRQQEEIAVAKAGAGKGKVAPTIETKPQSPRHPRKRKLVEPALIEDEVEQEVEVEVVEIKEDKTVCDDLMEE